VPRAVLDASPLSAATPLAEDVASRLREAIVRGEFQPDARVHEELVAATLGTSRGPVREALRQLEREGLVVRRRHRGAFIARLSAEDASEIFTLRLVFERLAMETAARSAEDEDFERLEAGLQNLADAVTAHVSLQTLTSVDLDFHDLIYRAAHFIRLYRLWSELRPQVHILLLSGWGKTPGDPGFADFVVRVHREMIDVLRSRDAVRAGRVAEEHIRRNYEKLIAAHRKEDAHVDRRIAERGLQSGLPRSGVT
jgi:DNA-binding GntR family transcriptional regulator